VMRTIFGIDKKDKGEVLFDGKHLKGSNPKLSMKKGIAFVPEDRQSQGVILEQSLTRNITLPLIDDISKFGMVNTQKEKELTSTYGKMMEIKAASDRVIVMHEGSITKEFSREEANSDNVIKAATGHKEEGSL